MRRGLLYSLAVTSTLSVLPVTGSKAEDAPVPQDTSSLLNLSLQQLSDEEVTSVSKKAEKASQAAAAIYVITQEDIRRSGMQSVPELLRMVPGLQVAQTGSQNWAITSRGFDSQFSNKLLVLIDGRTVYTPVFSGVYWDVQNLMLEDVERIEVIRGPGATLWGANAVNGVINIITKSAKDTQGTLLTGAVGNQERVAAGARYGGTEGDLSYRTYAQYFNDNQQHTVANPVSGVTTGMGAQDQWHNGQGGFRLDWGNADKEGVTLQGDAYTGQENALRFLPVTASVSPTYFNVVDDTDDVSGVNVLGRWKHEINSGSDITLQGYYDDVNREFEDVGSSLHTQTFDVDFQHNLTLDAHNDLTWGLGYRFINSAFGNSFYISYAPENYYENLFSGFVQDKMALVPDKLFLTFGTKLEHNDFSGFEYEPSVRLSWIPSENQTVWAAVSRAVRAETQSDRNLNLTLATIPTPAPFTSFAASTVLAEVGSSEAVSEDVTTYELGYRIQPRRNISIDLTGYINEYDHLASLAQGSPSIAFDPSQGTFVFEPEVSQNLNSGETHGFEAATTWQATKSIKISGAYTLYYSDFHIVGASLVTASGTSPKQQFNLRSYVDLPYNVQWDTMLYYVDSLPAVGDGFGDTVNIPAYTRLDMRLGWVPVQGLDLSLIGQNLLQSQHEEFSPFLYQTPEEISRSVLAKATLRF
jgi:iron complex outermembrane receptor protein